MSIGALLLSLVISALLLRACLHGGGVPKVGEVTRLAVVGKWPALHANLRPRGPGVTLLDVVAWSISM